MSKNYHDNFVRMFESIYYDYLNESDLIENWLYNENGSTDIAHYLMKALNSLNEATNGDKLAIDTVLNALYSIDKVLKKHVENITENEVQFITEGF